MTQLHSNMLQAANSVVLFPNCALTQRLFLSVLVSLPRQKRTHSCRCQSTPEIQHVSHCFEVTTLWRQKFCQNIHTPKLLELSSCANNLSHNRLSNCFGSQVKGVELRQQFGKLAKEENIELVELPNLVANLPIDGSGHQMKFT